MRDIHDVIAGDGPFDDEEAQALARAATAHLSGDLCDDLREQLVLDLTLLVMELTWGYDGEESRRAARATLEEIEAAGRVI